MSESKNLLHPVTKPTHEHENGEACMPENLDQSKGLLIRGLVDAEGSHWLSRDDILSFVQKESETFQMIFGHAAMTGDMLPQYMLASQVLAGFGALLDASTNQENVVDGTLGDDDLLRLLGQEPAPAPEPEKPAHPLDGVFGAIADAIKEAKKEQEEGQ